MNLHVVSDLHLDRMPSIHSAPVGTDVVVVAGDVAKGAAGVAWSASTFAGLPVIYVPGNHEHYGAGSLSEHLPRMMSRATGTGVHVCDRRTVVIGGVRFLGATLWTDYALDGDRDEAMRVASELSSDCSNIRIGNFPAGPEDFLDEHIKSVRWLCGELAEPFDGATVVVTHHAPSNRSSAPMWAGDPMCPCFASSLEWMMHRFSPELWVHGHIHVSSDYTVGATRVLANPRGHVDRGRYENQRFDPAMVVSVGAGAVGKLELAAA